jgi:hypothetical protein
MVTTGFFCVINHGYKPEQVSWNFTANVRKPEFAFWVSLYQCSSFYPIWKTTEHSGADESSSRTLWSSPVLSRIELSLWNSGFSETPWKHLNY